MLYTPHALESAADPPAASPAADSPGRVSIRAGLDIGSEAGSVGVSRYTEQRRKIRSTEQEGELGTPNKKENKIKWHFTNPDSQTTQRGEKIKLDG